MDYVVKKPKIIIQCEKDKYGNIKVLKAYKEYWKEVNDESIHKRGDNERP